MLLAPTINLFIVNNNLLLKTLKKNSKVIAGLACENVLNRTKGSYQAFEGSYHRDDLYDLRYS